MNASKLLYLPRDQWVRVGRSKPNWRRLSNSCTCTLLCQIDRSNWDECIWEDHPEKRILVKVIVPSDHQVHHMLLKSRKHFENKRQLTWAYYLICISHWPPHFPRHPHLAHPCAHCNRNNIKPPLVANFQVLLKRIWFFSKLTEPEKFTPATHISYYYTVSSESWDIFTSTTDDGAFLPFKAAMNLKPRTLNMSDVYPHLLKHFNNTVNSGTS